MRHFILILACFAFAQNANAQDSTLAKFLMIGHAYGSQDTAVPQWKSIIDNVEKINSFNADFIPLLGDFIRDTTAQSIREFKDSLIRKKLNDPTCALIFVHGNHDVIKPRDYPRISCCFGKDWFNIFDMENKPNTEGYIPFGYTEFPYEIYIINTEDTTLNLDSLIRLRAKNAVKSNIVFLSHRLIWAYSNPRYAHLVELTNSPTMHQLPQVVDMDFLNQQKDKKFYFFAGDLGVNIPLFYDKVDNVTMYAVGCGGTPKDAALLAEFKRDTILTSLVHLGTANYSIEDYSLEKINTMPLPNVTISAQQGFKGYQWPVVLGIFALMALALYMVVTPNE